MDLLKFSQLRAFAPLTQRRATASFLTETRQTFSHVHVKYNLLEKALHMILVTAYLFNLAVSQATKT